MGNLQAHWLEPEKAKVLRQAEGAGLSRPVRPESNLSKMTAWGAWAGGWGAGQARGRGRVRGWAELEEAAAAHGTEFPTHRPTEDTAGGHRLPAAPMGMLTSSVPAKDTPWLLPHSL